MGVAGKECATFVDEGNKILLRENDLEVDGLSRGPSDDGVSGRMRTVLSPSWAMFFALKLRWGSKLLTDDLNLAELRLGGRPALEDEELGLGTEGTSIVVKSDKQASKDRTGICKEERFGRLDCWTKLELDSST